MGSVLGFWHQAIKHSFDDAIFEVLTEVAMLKKSSAVEKRVVNTGSLFCHRLDWSSNQCVGSIRLALHTLGVYLYGCEQKVLHPNRK